jgi:hypothetical protein
MGALASQQTNPLQMNPANKNPTGPLLHPHPSQKPALPLAPSNTNLTTTTMKNLGGSGGSVGHGSKNGSSPATPTPISAPHIPS